jgi:hypothetical protein
MKYYPLNRVKTNQRTTGNRFLLNGNPYSGLYYETYDGQYFTGPNPTQGPSQRLLPIAEEAVQDLKGLKSTSNFPDNNDLLVQQYSAVSLDRQSQVITYQTPQPYYPRPTDTDYKRGSIMRYFAKKRNQPGYIMEVNKETHDSLKTTDSVYDYITYEAIDTLWQITGPLRDNRTAKQYKIAGIIDTNKRLIEAKEAKFPGLVAYIGGDYAKFAKPTG